MPARKVTVRRRVMSEAASLSNGHYGHVGIGIKVARQDGHHYVTSIFPGGPADSTGRIWVGDRIISINGTIITHSTTVAEVSSMILGPPGGIIELQLGADDDDDGSLHRKDSPGADAQKNQDDTRSPSVNGSSQGADAGVGLKLLHSDAGDCRVIDVQARSPAEESKRVHIGDQLLQVDGISVTSSDAQTIQRALSGLYGTSVTLTICSSFDGVRSGGLSQKTRRDHTPTAAAWQNLFPIKS
eukprot:Tamp_25165.p1 GENE.Tamp_25165~~Tamp_25165.p1  ORF type:complete len:242 (+),score=17.23 Tamp_25165:1-726(+)